MSGIDLSLDRIRILFGHLPRYDRPTCHIAGTNGKGSVSAFLTSIFRSPVPPYRIGRYNSPHLVSVYDCITIDDFPVAPEVYAAARSKVEKVNTEHNAGATSFEVLTLTALQVFQDLKVDIAVVEVGMGGRLDATNVIPDECILVSALTSVDLDHQSFLGNTVADIAREKVGIARAGKPFVLSRQRHEPVDRVVQEACQTVGADLVHAIVPSIRPWNQVEDGPTVAEVTLTTEHFLTPEPQPIQVSLPCFPKPIHALLPLQGEHQLTNLGTALTMISILLTKPPCSDLSLGLSARIAPDTVRKGIQSTVWPGRLSFHKFPATTFFSQPKQDLLVLADGAHNPASAATLSAYITKVFSQVLCSSNTKPRTIALTYVLSLSHSPPKTPLQTVSPLLPPTLPGPSAYAVDVKVNIVLLRFTPPDGMPWVKSVPPSELQPIVRSLCPEARIWAATDDASSVGQLQDALRWTSEQHRNTDGSVTEGMIVLAGSLYLVADFYRLLGEVNA